MKPAAVLPALALLGAAASARAQDKPADPAAPAASGPLDTVVAVPAPAEPSDTPVVHYPPPIVRLGLVGFGLLVSGAAWGASFASGVNWPTVPGSAQLKIPIAGPWIALGKSGCATDDPLCGSAKIGVRGAIYVLDGVAQLAGLALIVEAIVMKTESAASLKKEVSVLPSVHFRGLELSAVPVTSPTMQGIGLTGTF